MPAELRAIFEDPRNGNPYEADVLFYDRLRESGHHVTVFIDSPITGKTETKQLNIGVEAMDELKRICQLNGKAIDLRQPQKLDDDYAHHAGVFAAGPATADVN